MTTYILLRDNKESTPLTLDQLKSLGIKSTDLIWVEGQSVCWMHPGQIKELKDIGLPPVKNPETFIEVSEEEIPVPAAVIPVPEEPVIKQEEIKPDQKLNVIAEHTAVMPVKTEEKKKVFVVLPKTETKKATVFASESPKQIIDNKTSDFPVAETKYSRPLDEIKELYLENLEKQKRSRFGFQLTPEIKKAAVYFLLFLTGIAAGILFTRSLNKKDTIAQTDKARIAGTENISYEQPVGDSSAYYAMNNGEAATTTVAENAQYPKANKFITGSQNTALPLLETLQTNTEVLPVPAPAEADLDAQKNKGGEEEAPKPSIKELYSQVSVKNNQYSVGSFGGIKNLELTVNNKSRFALDEVEVQVQYFKPGNELINTETVKIHDIGAGGSKTIAVPKSKRGVKVGLKLSGIKSSDLLSNTAGL
jgi:hypothetical protein